MSKPGRNDPCPCGSGRKYKHCCLHHSLPQADAEFRADTEQRDDRSIEALEGLSLNQMNALLIAPLSRPGTIRIANRVDAGPDVPVLMMLHEMRMAIEANRDIACTRNREVQPKLAERIYNKFRRMRPYDGLLEEVRVRTEMDVPIVRAARGVLKVSGHLRTYANRFILSSSCREQLYSSEYSTVYPEIFRSYARKFNWSYWGSPYEDDPFQQFFCFTLFQLARHGDDFVSPGDYAVAFFRAIPTVPLGVEDDDEPLDAMDHSIHLYIIHVVVQFWGFLGLVEFGDSDPKTDEIPFVRATPLFRELIQFPAEWFVET